MGQADTIERPTQQHGRETGPRSGNDAGPRPVTARVAQFETSRERRTQGRPLPSPLLTLTQRIGSHPWLTALAGAVVGGAGAALQKVVPWAPFVLVGIVVVLAVSAVVVAVIVRRRVRLGGLVRMQEVVIDTDQAIPAAMIAPIGALVGWMCGTLLF